MLFRSAWIEWWVRRPKLGAEGAVWIHWWCRRIVRALGFQCTVEGWIPHGGVVVSNHLSYLDILLYSSVRPFVMVAKTEVRGWPLMGWITSRAGTVYVERGGGPTTWPAVNAAMSEAYRSGLPVLFFPEGTTTNGEQVLNFHSGILAQAMLVDEPVTAGYIEYSLGEGNAAGASVADDVAFWGDQTMWPHMWRFVGLRNVRAKVRFADGPIVFSSDVMHRKQVAVEAREALLALAPEGIPAEAPVSETV